ncbi:PLC-like phosphodiesterase [Lentinula raphanica]|nr:PLC-like phosphodiesterase [Lentinula raphanica]
MSTLSWTSGKPYAPFGSDEQSNYAPAATVHNGRLWLVWSRTGSNGVNGLYCASTSLDSATSITTASWQGPTQMQDPNGVALICTNSPAICDIGGYLQVVFPASTSSGSGYPVHYTYDDVTGHWIQQYWESSHAQSGLSLAAYRGEMYCAFRGNNDYINLAVWTPPTSSGGGVWVFNYADSHLTKSRPGLFVALDANGEETLNLVWGDSGSGTLRQASFSHWYPYPSEPVTAPFAQDEKTSDGATAFSGAYGAYLAFRKNKEQSILVCVYSNGIWQKNQALNQATKTNPAIVAFQNNVYCFFTSSNGPSTLFVVSAQVNSIHPSNWMATLDSSKSIAQYTLPGTHDSAAGTLIASGGDWLTGAQTQTLDIYHQLLSGIRFLDLRVDLYAGIIHCFHGVFPLGVTLDAIFRQMYRFLDTYTTEAIIVSIKHEGPQVETDETLWKAIDALMNQNGQTRYWWNYTSQLGVGPGYTGLPTLAQAKGKIILMRRSSYPFPFGIPVPNFPDNAAHGTVFLPPNSAGIAEEIQFQDQYEATGNTLGDAIAQKERVVEQFLIAQTDIGRSSNLGHVLMMNFTSAASNVWTGGYYPHQLATGDGLKGLNEFLLYRLQLRSNLPVPGIGSLPGIIIMDYPEFPQGALISSIYNQNFQQ